jgi:hypothetical protein
MIFRILRHYKISLMLVVYFSLFRIPAGARKDGIPHQRCIENRRLCSGLGPW